MFHFCTASELLGGSVFVSWGLLVGYFVKKETFFSSQDLLWVKGESLEPDAKKACSKLVLDLTVVWISLNNFQQGV